MGEALQNGTNVKFATVKKGTFITRERLKSVISVNILDVILTHLLDAQINRNVKIVAVSLKIEGRYELRVGQEEACRIPILF